MRANWLLQKFYLARGQALWLPESACRQPKAIFDDDQKLNLNFEVLGNWSGKYSIFRFSGIGLACPSLTLSALGYGPMGTLLPCKINKPQKGYAPWLQNISQVPGPLDDIL